MDRREFVRRAAAGLGGLFVASSIDSPLSAETARIAQRPLGTTGHESGVVALGGMTVSNEDQKQVNRLVDDALAAGVNHIDAAPTYGDCEVLFGKALAGRRNEVFLACKTTKRDKQGATEELHKSLERLQTDYLDLYQMHALDDSEERQQALGPGGALEAFLEAREQGIVRFLGITGHNPDNLLSALNEFNFDTVMFPINFILQHHGFGLELLAEANRRGIGVIAIKPIAERHHQRGEPRRYPKCWYKPLNTNEEISRAVWYALAQPVSTILPSASIRLFRRSLSAARHVRPLSTQEASALQAKAVATESLFS